MISTAVDPMAVDLYTDTRDFEQLYRQEYSGLLAVATALTGNFADGEDVVHDCFVKAFIQWPRVRRLDRPGGWCHRVLTNLCRSRWRRSRTRQRWLERQRVEPYRESLTAEVMSFWGAVRSLPERPRLAVALYYGADRSVAEIAAILAVPEGTVRSDLTRARVVLAQELGY